MSGDPTRLTDGSEAPEELRNLLANAREDVPSESQLKRVATRLGPLLGGAVIGSAAGAGVGAASTSGATAGATGGVALGVKVGAALVAAGLVGGGALWYVARAHNPPPAAPAPVAAPAAPAKTHAAPAPAAKPVAEDTAQPPAKSAANPKPAPVKAGESAHKAAPSEASLLQSAQAALETDPHRALALVAEHRRLYPHGALSQEREVIEIEALTRLGRTQQARQKAKDFKQRYPDSAQKSKVGATIDSE